MKKYVIALLLALLLIVLVACGDTVPEMSDTQVQSQTETNAQQPTEGEQVLTEEEQQIIDMVEADAQALQGDAPEADEYSWEMLEGKKQDDGILLETAVYSLLLPEDWEGRYVAEESGHWLYFYSKENQDAGYGGLLFSVAWLDEAEQQVGMVPQHDMGYVTIDGIDYKVGINIITDIQAPESGELREEYLSMQEDILDILDTIDFGVYVFTAIE